MHAHAFPYDIAGRAIEKLTSMGDWEPYGDGTIEGKLQSMDEAGVDMTAVCGIATKPGQGSGILKWLVQIVREHPGRFIPFGSLHPEDTDPGKWFDSFASEGVSAIKLHAFYQDFTVDDESMFPIYEAAAERGFLVAFHSGRDVGFMDDPSYDRVCPRRIASVAAKFPTLKILCTHMGGWLMWDSVAAHLADTGVCVETSYTMPFIEKEKFIGLVNTLGSDRVCFGTDWPWQDRKDELQRLREMEFDDAVLEQIYHKTAERLIDLSCAG